MATNKARALQSIFGNRFFHYSSFNPLKAAEDYLEFVTENKEHSLQQMSPLAINCSSTSTETDVVSTLGAAWGVPIVTNQASSSPSLDYNSFHPDIMLLYPTNSGDYKAVVGRFSQLGTTRFACVYVRDVHARVFYLSVQAELNLAKMNVSPVLVYNQVTTQEDVRFMV